MKRRRWSSEIEIGDPQRRRSMESAEGIPELGEAGPSDWQARRAPSRALRIEEGGDVEDRFADVRGLGENEDGSERIAGHRTPLSPPIIAALPLLLLPFLPLAEAAPPLERRPPPPPPPRFTNQAVRNRRRSEPFVDVDYYPEVDTTPILPTATSVLPETVLPYVVTQLPDGSWTNIEYGWSVFGRQAGPTNPVLAADSPSATADSASLSWAIEQSLPTGWGATSNRTDIYKVSLISVAAVIMAIGIVAGIMIIVINRRKAHRRAKRRAERIRRKELAAAGLTEDDINGSAANAAFEDRLEELELQHRAPKGAKKGHGSIVRVKVRAWRGGLRRRKGKKTEDEAIVEVIEEDDKPVESPSSSDHSGHSLDGDSDSSRHGSTTDERPSSGNTDTSGTSPVTTQASRHSTDRPVLGPVADTDTRASEIAYFPPAYRPASVRSLPLSGPSTSTSQPPPAHPAEKTGAPGYYPAPVNEESEAAIAIVSRSDGKAPIRESEREEREREHIRHIATDDKRELERMRLAASAPGSASPAIMIDGPSAPGVEVDEQGFEQVSLGDALPESSASPAVGGGLLPPPPARLRSSSRTNAFDEDHEGVERGVDETLQQLHLVPSAPPDAAGHFEIPSAPSAPPALTDEYDEHQPSAPIATVPSAPPFAPEDEDDDDLYDLVVGGRVDGERDSGEASTHPSSSSRASSHDIPRAPAVDNTGDQSQGQVFLPKYEP